MQFTTIALAALAGLTSAQKVQVVTVGSSNNSLVFSPNNVKAAVGDMVQFQFVSGNHTVTQSTFDNPCAPINTIQSNVSGVHSGYMPVAASKASGMIPTYTVQINNTTPLWMYCAQGRHCQGGMVMVINENTAANASRSLANYKSIAAKATSNSAPSSGSGSGSGSGTGSSTGGGSGTGTGTGAGTGSNNGSAASNGNGGTATTAGSSMVKAGSTISLAGFVAAALLL